MSRSRLWTTSANSRSSSRAYMDSLLHTRHRRRLGQLSNDSGRLRHQRHTRILLVRFRKGSLKNSSEGLSNKMAPYMDSALRKRPLLRGIWLCMH